MANRIGDAPRAAPVAKKIGEVKAEVEHAAKSVETAVGGWVGKALHRKTPNPPNATFPASGELTEPNASKVISKWGTDFNQHMGPTRSKEDLAKLAHDVTDAQEAFASQQSRGPERGMHAKGVFASGAEFKVSSNLPKELQYGPFQPGATLKGVVRYSNGSGKLLADGERDRRGLAFRVTDGAGKNQDFLLVSGSEQFIARDGAAAVAGLKAEAKHGSLPGPLGAAAALASLTSDLVKEHGLEGIDDARKMITQQKATGDEGESLAANTYYSRVPYQVGDHAVKMRLVPKDTDTRVIGNGDDSLRKDLQARLAKGPVTYALQVKGYTNAKDTPVDDARQPWKNSEYITIGELTIPQQKVGDAQAEKMLEDMNKLSFSPWHRWDGNDDRALKPLGDVNNVRKVVYEESAKGRGSGGPNTLKCPYGFG